MKCHSNENIFSFLKLIINVHISGIFTGGYKGDISPWHFFLKILNQETSKLKKKKPNYIIC